MAPQPPVVAAAQNALHEMYQRGGSSRENALRMYSALKYYAISSSPGHYKAIAERLNAQLAARGGQDATNAAAFRAVLALTPAQIKAGGGFAPPSHGADSVDTSITGSITKDLTSFGITGFFSALTQANTWLRVAEVALGVLLLAVGLGKLTGVDYGKVAGLVATRGMSAAGSLKSAKGTAS